VRAALGPVAVSGARASCRSCAHFRNDPAYIEATIKGLATMSSAHASVRADDGVCLRHDVYLSAEASCDDHTLVSRAGR
jgi:hypothetical protein